jgi:hypothetical protein
LELTHLLVGAGSLINWDDHLDRKYGKKGTPTREKYAEEFEAFKIGILIQKARKKQKTMRVTSV